MSETSGSNPTDNPNGYDPTPTDDAERADYEAWREQRAQADQPAETVPEAPGEPTGDVPEGDGTVGDFDGDVAAYNNRKPVEYTDERGNVNTEAEFRSATGHDDSEQTDPANVKAHEQATANQ